MGSTFGKTMPRDNISGSSVILESSSDLEEEPELEQQSDPDDPPQPKVSPEYLRYYEDRLRNQFYINKKLGFGERGYPEAHPSEFELPFDRHGQRAVYGETQSGHAIPGPVHWTQFHKDWDQIGQRYKDRFNSMRPILRVEEKYLNRCGFYLISRLGSGGYGVVFKVKATQLVKDEETKQYIEVFLACKLLSLTSFKKKNRSLEKSVKELLHESEIHTDLHHENIVRTEHVFHIHDDVSDFPHPIRLCHFMELCDGDLNDRLEAFRFKMPENEAFVWFFQISNAIKYIHDRKIFHSDIKLRNVLYRNTANDIVYKLSDFGLAVKYGSDEPMVAKKMKGTLAYKPPEGKKEITPTFETKPADIYSLGICLAYTLTGVRERNQIMTGISTGRTQNLGYSAHVISLIAEMTNSNPGNRPTIDEVLNSDWVNSLKP